MSTKKAVALKNLTANSKLKNQNTIKFVEPMTRIFLVNLLILTLYNCIAKYFANLWARLLEVFSFFLLQDTTQLLQLYDLDMHKVRKNYF